MRQAVKEKCKAELDLALSQLPPNVVIEVPAPEETHKLYKGWWRLRVSLSIPSNAILPKLITLSIYIDEHYPFGNYAVIPDDEAIYGHPHQEAITRKLCLQPDFVIGNGPHKLWQIIRSAKKWLEAADSGLLAKPHENYELPDFSGKLPRVIFNETAETFKKWTDVIPSMGVCDVSKAKQNLYIAKNLHNESHEKIFSDVLEYYDSICAGWILIDREPVTIRRNPCLTWNELTVILEISKIDLYEFTEKIWTQLDLVPGLGGNLVLIGFPIPLKNSDASSEIHWQPLLIDSFEKYKNSLVDGYRKGKAPLKDVFQRIIQKKVFKSNDNIAWLKSSNASHVRLFGRGMLEPQITEMRFAIFGLGALGSNFSHMLVREGVNEVALFDGDSMEPGNVCRHVGSFIDSDETKAELIEAQLLKINPYLSASAYHTTLPVAEKTEPFEEILKSDYVIDCTASEKVLLWEDQLIKEHDCNVIKLYLTYGADYLCMFGHAPGNSLSSVNEKILAMKGKSKIPDDFFDLHEDTFFEGAGCYHPTFPARIDRIMPLLGLALQRLATRFNDANLESDWALIIGYRKSKDDTCPTIEPYFEGKL